eukprot:475316-Prorocentrum_lima.AAC.1
MAIAGSPAATLPLLSARTGSGARQSRLRMGTSFFTAVSVLTSSLPPPFLLSPLLARMSMATPLEGSTTSSPRLLS